MRGERELSPGRAGSGALFVTDERASARSRRWGVPVVFGALYLGSGGAIASIEAGVWGASRLEAIIMAAVFPPAYLGLFAALQWYSTARRLRRGDTLVMAAHAVTFTASTFVIVYVASQVWDVPLLIKLLPMLGLVLGWMAVLPLTIHAFARTRSWLALVPLLGYLVAAGVSFPVMLHMT